MRIAVRTVAGKQVGYGHLRRCLTLADALREHGAEVCFWIEGTAPDDLGFASSLVAGDEPGATLARIDAERPDAVVADSYRFGADWFSAVRPRAKLLVVDDLADRLLDADVVTNSAVDAAELPYRTGAGCRLLLGASYALVRSAFREAAHPTQATVQRVLVTLGGSDPQFRTRGVVGTLQALLPSSVSIDVIVGPLHGEDGPLDQIAQRDPRVTLHRGVTDLAPLVATADLAVSAGGQTTFELACAGVPAVSLAVADNQRLVLAGFARAGTLVYAGDAGADLGESVERLIADESLRRTMSEAGRQLVDGRGAERVAAALLEQIQD